MKIADHLSNKEKKELNKIKERKKQNRKPKAKKEEKIDWHDLMGCNNRGLVRGKGGAFKRR